MPELMIDFITSLEGYGAADGWPGRWGLDVPEYLQWLEDQPEADYTILMGANTYRLMLDLAADGEPGIDALTGEAEDRLLQDLDGAAVVAEHTTCGAGRRGGRARHEGQRRGLDAHAGQSHTLPLSLESWSRGSLSAWSSSQ